MRPNPLNPGWPEDMPPLVRAFLEAQGARPEDIVEIDLDELVKGNVEAAVSKGGMSIKGLHDEPGDYKANSPPPASMLKGIPGDTRENALGFPTAYLRLYSQKPEDRGEWFVLCLLNGDPRSAFCFVRSPWGEGADDLGSVDLTALDRYTQIFDCGPIVLDMDFTPRPFSWRTGETHDGRFEVRLDDVTQTPIASFDDSKLAADYIDRRENDGDLNRYVIEEAEDAT